jgi:phosphoserine phosphatase
MPDPIPPTDPGAFPLAAVPEAEVAELPASADAASTEPPLAVDIDGTLIATDMFLECALAFANLEGPMGIPGQLAQMAWVIRRGRPELKRWLAENLRLEFDDLPWQTHILEFLRGEHARGRRLILATAADMSMARQVAERLGIFEEVLASRPGLNLKSHRKAEALVQLYGEGGFDYIGDALPDLRVWCHARKALVVSSQPEFIAKVRALMGGDESRVRVFPSAMRFTSL